MSVTRVHQPNGSHIEPPLDDEWDDLTKLQWQAAVIAHDTGLELEVEETSTAVFVVWTKPKQSSSYYTFNDAWRRMTALSDGAAAYKRQTEHQKAAGLSIMINGIGEGLSIMHGVRSGGSCVCAGGEPR